MNDYPEYPHFAVREADCSSRQLIATTNMACPGVSRFGNLQDAVDAARRKCEGKPFHQFEVQAVVQDKVMGLGEWMALPVVRFCAADLTWRCSKNASRLYLQQ